MVSLFLSFGKRYEIDLRVIFYQWPKLGLGLDVEAEIQILKVIYYIFNFQVHKAEVPNNFLITLKKNKRQRVYPY